MMPESTPPWKWLKALSIVLTALLCVSCASLLEYLETEYGGYNGQDAEDVTQIPQMLEMLEMPELPEMPEMWNLDEDEMWGFDEDGTGKPYAYMCLSDYGYLVFSKEVQAVAGAVEQLLALLTWRGQEDLLLEAKTYFEDAMDELQAMRCDYSQELEN